LDLTASRIWWITRKTESVISGHSKRLYHTIIAIILESGIIYPVLLTINVAFYAYQPKIIEVVDLSPTATLFAGIAPTLIIIR
ncbi:hypothetical protein L218DRAFT_841137, partial [Marasmius fiardii PR-910]